MIKNNIKNFVLFIVLYIPATSFFTASRTKSILALSIKIIQILNVGMKQRKHFINYPNFFMPQRTVKIIKTTLSVPHFMTQLVTGITLNY